MNLLTAVITRRHLHAVTGALEAAGFEPMMAATARPSAGTRADLVYRGVAYADPSAVRVELLVADRETERAAGVIRTASGPGEVAGDEVRMWSIEVSHPLGPTGWSGERPDAPAMASTP